MAVEYWSNGKEDYSGANTTYWYEDHEKSLVTDAYEDYTSWEVGYETVSEKWVGQNLDYYWEETQEQIYDFSWYTILESQYGQTFATGNQSWEEMTYDPDTDDGSYTMLNYGADSVWTGMKAVYSEDSTDVYLYQEWPDSYILLEDYDLPFGDWDM
jgi:hypothetical protein